MADFCKMIKKDGHLEQKSLRSVFVHLLEKKMVVSVTRLGNLLNFGQLFKASGNN